MRRRMRTVAKSLFYSVLVVIVRSLACWHSWVPRWSSARRGGALANLVSGGTASPPRSPVRVGGAPRRAAPLYISGAVRQPTSRHGSVRARASKDNLCSRTCGDGPSRGFQDGQHRHGAAEKLEPAAIGGHRVGGGGGGGGGGGE